MKNGPKSGPTLLNFPLDQEKEEELRDKVEEELKVAFVAKPATPRSERSKRLSRRRRMMQTGNSVAGCATFLNHDG